MRYYSIKKCVKCLSYDHYLPLIIFQVQEFSFVLYTTVNCHTKLENSRALAVVLESFIGKIMKDKDSNGQKNQIFQ